MNVHIPKNLTRFLFLSLLVGGAASLLGGLTTHSLAATATTSTSVLSDTPTTSRPSTATSTPRIIPAVPIGSGALSREQQARVTNLAANISTRLELTIDRLRQISERLEARSTLIAAAGIDISTAQAALATASSSLTQASYRLANIDQQVMEFVSAPTVLEGWASLRATYEAAERDIKSAHADLTTALEILSGIPATAAATSSNPTMTPQP